MEKNKNISCQLVFIQICVARCCSIGKKTKNLTSLEDASMVIGTRNVETMIGLNDSLRRRRQIAGRSPDSFAFARVGVVYV